MDPSLLGVVVRLTQGFVTVVDEADVEFVLAEGPWAVHSTHGHYYARAGRTLLHTMLTGFRTTDHIDGCGLNNTRANLREVTVLQNLGNQQLSRRNTTGFKGVVAHRSKWRAQMSLASRPVRLGTFASPEEAALAYDDAARGRWGEHAALNFPSTGERAARARVDYSAYRDGACLT